MKKTTRISETESTPAQIRKQIQKLEEIKISLCDTFAFTHILEAIEALKLELN